MEAGTRMASMNRGTGAGRGAAVAAALSLAAALGPAGATAASAAPSSSPTSGPLQRTARARPAADPDSAVARTVALTFDDLPWADESVPLDSVELRTREMLEALREHGAPSVAFVVGRRVLEGDGADRRLALLRSWRDAGARLADHGWEHIHFQADSLDAYEDNAAKGYAIPGLLMGEVGRRPVWYRPPYNQTGPTMAVRDSFAAFLHRRGRRLAPFTIEDVDYAFDALYRAAADDTARRSRIERAYRAYFDTAMAYGERLSRETFGREIPQVLLLHANDLNARNLGWILDRLQARSYRFVTLDEAVSDEAYATPDGYAGPWGISWLDRWRMALGLPNALRTSPDPPKWVLEAYRKLQ